MRPLARRRDSTALPLLVFMRERNPCVFERCRRLGWNVRLGMRKLRSSLAKNWIEQTQSITASVPRWQTGLRPADASSGSADLQVRVQAVRCCQLELESASADARFAFGQPQLARGCTSQEFPGGSLQSAAADCLLVCFAMAPAPAFAHLHHACDTRKKKIRG